MFALGIQFFYSKKLLCECHWQRGNRDIVFNGCGCVSSTKQKGCLCYSSSLQYWKTWANLLEWDKICLWSPSSAGQQQQWGHLIYHHTYCFAATEMRKEGEISQKASHNKLNDPPSSPKSSKMHSNGSILFIISGFVFSCSRDKPSIMASVLSATWGFHYGPTEYVHCLYQATHKSSGKEPISSYLHE